MRAADRLALPLAPDARAHVGDMLASEAVRPWLAVEVVSRALRRRLTKPDRSAGREGELLLPDNGLADLSSQRIYLTSEAVIRAIERVAASRERLRLGRCAITGIAPLGAETHNGGQRPLQIHFSRRHRLVYKPVSLVPDAVFQRVVATLAGAPGLPALWTPWLVPVDASHGFREYVAGPGTDGGAAAVRQRFFLRLGALSAVAYALNLTDMHLENVLANGEHPVFLDLETLLYRYPAGAPQDLTTTGLIQSPDLHSTPLSGIQGGGRVERLGVSMCEQRPGVPELAYRRPDWLADNRLRNEAGGLVDPTQHSMEIVEGFTCAYRVLMERREEIRALVVAAAPRDLHTRHILRFTSYYLLHLFRLIQPARAPDADRRAGLEGCLERDESAHGRVTQAVARCEAVDLLAGDVPYFFAAADATNLLHHSGCCVPNFFHETAVAALEERLSSLCETDLAAQSELLVGGLASSTRATVPVDRRQVA